MTTGSSIAHHLRRLRALLRTPMADIVQYLLLILLLVWLGGKGAESIGYNWQWYQVPRFLYSVGDDGFHPGPLLTGLWITLKISGISLVLALIIGLITAMLRLSTSFVGRGVATFYLEVSRNTPLLIQIFLMYFVLGPALNLERMPAAILALSLFEGAYASEIFRSGIESVDHGQVEAAQSIGLSPFAIYRFIILPQALRTVLPPLTSQMISLIKDSALVSTIAIYDLTMQAQSLVSETYLTFEIWFTVAAIYLTITLTLSFLVGIMEKRLRLP